MRERIIKRGAGCMMTFVIMLSMIIATYVPVLAANGETTVSRDTLKFGQELFDEYMQNTHQEIVIGSQEYADFIVDQLSLGVEQKLKNLSGFDSVELYMVYYINNVNDPQKVIIQGDGNSELAMLRPNVLRKTEDKAQMELVKNDLDSTIEANNTAEVLGKKAAKGYSPSAAANYGYDHGKKYNTPDYPKLTADCTNFVSQCVKAGGKSFNYAPGYKKLPSQYETTKYWYSYHYCEISPYHRYKQSTSFMRVSDFYTYWKNHGATIISCSNKAAIQSKAKKGDIVQLYDKRKKSWYHSIIISRGGSGNWKYAGHTSDRKDEPIKNLDDSINKYRIIRIK